MEVTPKGLVTWWPPASDSAREEAIVLSLRDATGQEIFHTFKISVQPAGTPGPATAPTTTPSPATQPAQGNASDHEGAAGDTARKGG
jgi:hypothetical protein